MIDLIKKLLENINYILMGLIALAFALFSLFLGLCSIAEIVVKFATLFG